MCAACQKRSHADEGQIPHPEDAAVPEPGRRRLQGLGEGVDCELQRVRGAQRGRQVRAARAKAPRVTSAQRLGRASGTASQ